MPGPRRAPPPSDIDRHVGARMRERRIMLGLNQHQIAELIGVTYQQAHKYERGINRIAAGRLYTIAQALGTDVNHFFEGVSNASALMPRQKHRLMLELAKSFLNIPTREQQEVVSKLARSLADDGEA
jgi:transcriptional regulator with XRE-family HTH domain